MTAHSKIGASSYYRWKACPGSVRLCQNIESPESSYAKQGTLAHDIAGKALHYHFFEPAERVTIPLHFPEEDMASVKTYIEFIKKEVNRAHAAPDRGHIFIEHKFDLSSIYPGLFGTADCVIYAEREKKLIVVDYKHGQGIPVDVKNNLQLQYYALGALATTGLPCLKVEVVIVQPRCTHEDGEIRRWEFSSNDLLDFAATLAEDAKKTEDPNAELVPGNHCRFCPAAATQCPAIRDQASALAKIEFKKDLPYDPARLTKALDFIPAFEAWIKQVKEFAYSEAINNRPPPGYKLVEKRSTRKWIGDEKEITDYVTSALNRPIDDCFERKLKSPAQMEKMFSKRLVDKLRDFVTTESSGYTLAKDSDKRPAAMVLDAKIAFNDPVLEDDN